MKEVPFPRVSAANPGGTVTPTNKPPKGVTETIVAALLRFRHPLRGFD